SRRRGPQLPEGPTRFERATKLVKDHHLGEIRWRPSDSCPRVTFAPRASHTFSESAARAKCAKRFGQLLAHLALAHAKGTSLGNGALLANGTNRRAPCGAFSAWAPRRCGWVRRDRGLPRGQAVRGSSFVGVNESTVCRSRK